MTSLTSSYPPGGDLWTHRCAPGLHTGQAETVEFPFIPLTFLQVVTLAVYFYFAVALIGEQWLIRREK